MMHIVGTLFYHETSACHTKSAPFFIEYPFDPPTWMPERRDFMRPHPILPDETGHITPPDAPGLGVEIDWQHLEPLQREK